MKTEPGTITTVTAPRRSTGERTHREARKRTGCWICKHKHVRCTEERPICARCKRLNLECSYELKLLWKEDAKQRGICLGREGTWSRNGKRVIKPSTPQIFVDGFKGDHIFLNTTTRHFDHSTELEEPTDDEFEIAPRKSHALLPMPLKPQLGQRERTLLEYFISQILSNCALDSSRNPYYRCIIPMANSYQPLRHALVASAAMQRRILNDFRFEHEAFHYKTRALMGLQQCINKGQVGWPFVATIMMLCFFDISDGCDATWMTHLRGGLLGILQAEKAKITEGPMLRRFFSMWFVSQRVMSYTENYDDVDHANVSWAGDDDVDEIDVLVGISRTMVDLIDETARVSRRILDSGDVSEMDPQEVTELTTIRDDLETRIRTTKMGPPRGTPPVYADMMVGVSEVKRMTALLYLHLNVAALLPNADASQETELVEKVVTLLKAQPNTHFLLWPLFLIGRTSVENEHHRRFILERLDGLIQERNLGHVRVTKKVVQDEYRSSDLGRRGSITSTDFKWWADASLKGKWLSLA